MKVPLQVAFIKIFTCRPRSPDYALHSQDFPPILGKVLPVIVMGAKRGISVACKH